MKTQAHKPISTSFVHDCAVMYLYNDKTKTHAMYHAAPSTKVKRLNFFIKTLMPEGFTHASIVPGDYSFYKEQEPNMKNMFNTPQGKLVVGITIGVIVLVIAIGVYNSIFA